MPWFAEFLKKKCCGGRLRLFPSVRLFDSINLNLCFPQVVSVSEVGVDIDIGPGCLAQVHRGVGSTS
jgi:hypothetical protein